MQRIPAALILALAAGHVLAADPAIGYVKSVSGDAFVTTAGAKAKAQVGSPVQQGSLLETGKNGTMGVTFKDETMVSFGPNTSFTVTDYVYAPAEGKLKFGSKLAKGSLNYVSGAIEKMKPDAVTVGTPTGTIGVRGTQFLLKVEE
ncbi:MAG: hypothetical protein FIB06_02770 [Betaproteobacteria bacterium]|nr:hypothetical protein [Betaproteobacteria bacterium]